MRGVLIGAGVLKGVNMVYLYKQTRGENVKTFHYVIYFEICETGQEKAVS